MRRLLAAVGACGVGCLAATAAPTPVSVPQLVARLGSESFAEREQASRALELVGPDALPAVRAAAQGSSDPETRRRAELLADRLQRAADHARLLPSTTVRLDYQQVPLGTALNDLKARTGINLALDTNRVGNPLRPVTVRTGEVSVWQAVDAFCRAAGLREVFVAEFDQPTQPVRRSRGYIGPQPAVQLLPGQVPVTLADGPPDALPADRSTAVRVVALPPGFSGNQVVLGAGEITVNLDVTPAAGLNWQEVVEVKVRRAADEFGRRVEASYRQESVSDTPAAFEAGVVVFGGQMAVWQSQNDVVQKPPSIPNPRVVPVALRADEVRPKLLRSLEGSVVGEVLLANQPLVTVDDLTGAVGHTFEGANLTRLTITDVKAGPGGTVTVRLRTETPSPWVLRAMRPRRGGLNPVAAQMAWMEPAAPTAVGPQYRLFDAAGKQLPVAVSDSANMTDDGSKVLHDLDLVVRPAAGSGPPAKLVLVGSKAVTVEVPFRLENVPLP